MADDTSPPGAADAADMKVAEKAPFWWPAPRAFIVAWMMISSFAIVVLCWWKPPPPENQIVTMLISVYVSTGFVTALQWWMGSSKSSDDAHAPMIANATNKPAGP